MTYFLIVSPGEGMATTSGGWQIVLAPSGGLLAIAKIEQGRLKYRRVLAAQEYGLPVRTFLLIFAVACVPSVDTTAGALCASSDGTTSTCQLCATGACLTDQTCGPPVGPFDGGAFECGRSNPEIVGDRCREFCDHGNCPAGQQCYTFEKIWACSDTQRSLSVCCTAGSNCGH